MKPDELTPKALLEFFSELESGGTDEECELHYGCGCVIAKGVRAAQMLVEVQKVLGVESVASAAPGKPAAGATASGASASGTLAGGASDPERMELTDFEAALLAPGFPKAAAAPEPDPETAERLSEAEGEIDRLLIQTVDLKKENKLLREKIRDLYKQIERLYTRSEMSKLLGTLDEKMAREAEAASADPGEAEDADGGQTDTEAQAEAKAEVTEAKAAMEGEGGTAVTDGEARVEAKSEVTEAKAAMEGEGGTAGTLEAASQDKPADGEAEAVEDAASESSADGGKR